jgi:hypothetical protein
MAKIWNNYSPEILGHFPKLDKGKSLIFQVANTYFDKIMNKQVVPTSTTIRSIDRIYDPGHKAEIDIAFITGTRPLGPDKQRDEETILGEISFTRGNFGRWEYKGDKGQEGLARFLFFSNANGSNVGKPWYIEGTTQYKIIGDEGAAVRLKGDLLIDDAKNKLSEMTEGQRSQLAMAWFPQDHSRLTEEQIMLRLRTIAEKDPKRILEAENNPEHSLQAFVNQCQQAGLIKRNANDTEWQSKDGTLLVTVKGDETPYMAIRKFFLSDVGQKVRFVLEEEMTAVG